MLQRLQMTQDSLYGRLHNAGGSGRQHAGGDWHWRRHLPTTWQDAAVVPMDFRRFDDYEVPAHRVVGNDEDGVPCYCHWGYRGTVLRSDDGEEFYEEAVFSEAGDAWRLRDGRWLVLRRVGNDDGMRGGFRFSGEMPR